MCQVISDLAICRLATMSSTRALRYGSSRNLRALSPKDINVGAIIGGMPSFETRQAAIWQSRESWSILQWLDAIYLRTHETCQISETNLNIKTSTYVSMSECAIMQRQTKPQLQCAVV